MFRMYRGIDIQCRLALYAAGTTNPEPMWEQVVNGTNSFEVKVNALDPNPSFRSDSLKDLKAKFDELYFDLRDWKIGKINQ
ncbi:MAG: hypothetical protein ABI923_09805 [bacterium]